MIVLPGFATLVIVYFENCSRSCARSDGPEYPKEMGKAAETDAEEAVRASGGQGEGEAAPDTTGNRISGTI